MCWDGVHRHIAVVAVTLLFASSAIAQVIPPSEQLGRERERFTQPTAPQAQPGPGAISLPSTAAPDRVNVRAEFEHRFTAERMAHDYVGIYRQLLAARSRQAKATTLNGRHSAWQAGRLSRSPKLVDEAEAQPLNASK